VRRLVIVLGTAVALAGAASVIPPLQPRVAMAAAPVLPAGLNFGLGNNPGDLSWMTGSGVPWKFRYAYLSAGVNTSHGWETWNSPPGAYASYYMTASQANGYIPVFSYYELLQSSPSTGSDESSRDFSNLNNTSTMNAYYANFTLLMQKAHAFGGEVIVQVEPDLWGYLEQRANNGSPSTLSAAVVSSGNADLAGLPNTAQGFSWALLKLRDQYAPNVALAIHASLWASFIDIGTSTDPTVDPNHVADQTAAFLNAEGVTTNPYGSTYDLVFNDVADHDAAWYGNTSHWWDRNDVTLPNFARWLTYMARLHADTGRPLVVWQVPVGNQYFLTLNNSNGHYQDNRAEYFLSNPSALAAAGIGAVLFGKANAGQTNYTDDTGDGITNNGGAPTTGFECIACNTHVSQYADDDGGYLRIFVGQYYSCAGPGTTTPGPPAGLTPTFYFAEGFTGTGFAESLSLFMPNQSGTASIDYYTSSGHLPTVSVPLTAGHVTVENVNADVGCNQEVSARVTLPGPGVVERSLHFSFGAWHGSTDVVGATAPTTEWDFAEGSTLPFFSEYLTLQNPNAAPVTASLNYFTDGGAHPVKTVTLPANSRTTVQVFTGTLSNVVGCVPSGNGANCGVGPGLQGVSAQVLASAPIVAERPMYVNGFSFGSGLIRDGHDAFGANGAAKQWNFAEGTTLSGFYEYLTLQNPNVVAANVILRYLDDSGAVTTKPVSVAPQSRFTVPVFQTAEGVGTGVGGVSTQVTADQPIVAERPMYMVRDFGTGAVAGAHVVVGSTSLGTVFGFAAAATMAGDEDYLTIQNPNGVAANLTVTYYAASGTVARSLRVNANTRRTVVINDASAGSGGLGAGYASVGIVVSSDQPILVEKPTYSSNPLTYGATDTLGFSPAGGF
jgi:hypothetical protein